MMRLHAVGRRQLVKESLCSARGRTNKSIKPFTGQARQLPRVCALHGQHQRSDTLVTVLAMVRLSVLIAIDRLGSIDG